MLGVCLVVAAAWGYASVELAADQPPKLAPAEPRDSQSVDIPGSNQFLVQYGYPTDSCNDVLSAGSLLPTSGFLPFNRNVGMVAVQSVYQIAHDFGLSLALQPFKGAVCSWLKLLPKAGTEGIPSDERLQTSSLIALGDDAEPSNKVNVFAAVAYMLLVVWVFRGMYAMLWCHNFFRPQRTAWKNEPADTADHWAVDANYAKANYERETIMDTGDEDDADKAKATAKDAGKAKAKAKAKAKEGEDDEDEAGGMNNLKTILRWHHEGPFPVANADDWSAPLDPFDTVLEHHRPAAHYIRVYCSQQRYSLGWRIMNLLWSLAIKIFVRAKADTSEISKRDVLGTPSKNQ